MLNKRVEKITVDILDSLKINHLPIPIEEIAELRGLEIKRYDLGDKVSGVLVMDSGKGIIGVNPNEPSVRQRFTIAHELGHYELHRKAGNLFIDKGFVLYRDENSSKGEIRKELEANAFAAALLMPRRLVEEELQNHNFDLSDEHSMKELADHFNVSLLAMTFRIANLELFLKG